jgi:hypothetical protein
MFWFRQRGHSEPAAPRLGWAFRLHTENQMVRSLVGFGRRNIMRAGLCGLVACLAPQAQTASAQAQAANAGIPNLATDDSTSWYPPGQFGDNFLPPESGPGPVMSPPDHPYRPNDLDGLRDASSNPTYRVADLTNPILTPWAIEKMKPWNEMALSGKKIPFTARERCYPPGVPGWNVFRRVAPPMNFFVQTPKIVYMIWRSDMQVRRVYMNVPHSANPKPSWHGESVGHYEGGDTLVVDTIALLDHPLSFIDNYRTPHSDKLHVIERFHVLPGGNEIDVSIHVEDPIAFTTPWNAKQRLMKSTRGPLEEVSCAELGLNPGGEYFGLQSVPIPSDDTPDF